MSNYNNVFGLEMQTSKEAAPELGHSQRDRGTDTQVQYMSFHEKETKSHRHRNVHNPVHMHYHHTVQMHQSINLVVFNIFLMTNPMKTPKTTIYQSY